MVHGIPEGGPLRYGAEATCNVGGRSDGSEMRAAAVTREIEIGNAHTHTHKWRRNVNKGGGDGDVDLSPPTKRLLIRPKTSWEGAQGSLISKLRMIPQPLVCDGSSNYLVEASGID